MVCRAKDLQRRYSERFMSALTVIATPRRHVNVLQHIAGYFKNLLDRESKAELAAAIDDYRRGLVPLVVPITLVRHYVRLHNVSYLVSVPASRTPAEQPVRLARAPGRLARCRPVS